MKETFDPQLIKAVTEYYEYQGDRNAHPVKFVRNKNTSGYTMLLVRFIDEFNDQMSALMDYVHWKDGHWDVTETYTCERKTEKDLVNSFINSDEYV